MQIKEALTFDDILLVPNKSNILPNETDTQTLITSSISLNSPIMSSAMDTVTESRMAIAMAQYGGIGVIHRNLKIKEQVACVNDVKRFESAIVYNPITLRENQKLSDAKDLQKKLLLKKEVVELVMRVKKPLYLLVEVLLTVPKVQFIK